MAGVSAPAAIPRAILRQLQVTVAFVIDQVRRIPGARRIERRASLVALAFVLLAVVALIFWGSQRSPQRVSMAGLYAGDLSHMQTWIIVSGELLEENSSSPSHQYALTDASVPDAKLIVSSEVPLPVGQTTVSGTLVGGTGGAQPGFGWVGQLRADPVLAREPDPPWIAIGLVAAAVFLVVGPRTSYPVFFSEEAPRLAPPPRSTTLPVGVLQEGDGLGQDVLPGALALQQGGPIEVRVPGQDTRLLRLHSAYSSVEVGELRRLFDSEPALVVRPATGDLTLTFASNGDRDAAFAVIVANLLRRD